MDRKAEKGELKFKLSEKEQKVIEILRSLDFGEMRIVVNDGVVTRIEEVKKSYKI